MVDTLASRWTKGVALFAPAVGAFIKAKIHKFQSEADAIDFVRTRVTGNRWVTRWVERGGDADVIIDRLADIGWSPRGNKTSREVVDAALAACALLSE